MWVCLECSEVFESPKRYVETHGLETPPYEEFDGCPYCRGCFTKAYKCNCCEEWITDDYIKTDNDERYCASCYRSYEIGEEDF